MTRVSVSILAVWDTRVQSYELLGRCGSLCNKHEYDAPNCHLDGSSGAGCKENDVEQKVGGVRNVEVATERQRVACHECVVKAFDDVHSHTFTLAASLVEPSVTLSIEESSGT